MKQGHFWFTLIELTISVFILSLIIVGISFSLIKISENFSDSTIKTDIFEQIKEVNMQTYMFQYYSWIIYTGGILLYNDKNALLIGSFLDENNGYNYKFSYNPEIYNPYYFWIFYLNSEMLTSLLSEDKNIEEFLFNNWKIYNKLILKDIDIFSYNDGEIFEVSMSVFKRYKDSLSGVMKSEQFFPVDDYILFNFHF